MTSTSVLISPRTLHHRERLKRVAERSRRGYTTEEIADLLQRPLKTVKDDIEHLQSLELRQFRRERARERARIFELCQQTQTSLWNVVEGYMDSGDHRGVPAAARALLECVRMGESLRDADEKDVEAGRLTVRDIFEEMGPDYLDDPEPPQLGDGDAPQAKD